MARVCLYNFVLIGLTVVCGSLIVSKDEAEGFLAPGPQRVKRGLGEECLEGCNGEEVEEVLQLSPR